MNQSVKDSFLNYEIEYKIQNYHWWFLGRKKLLGSILHYINLLAEKNILEIGCGTGPNISVLNFTKFKVIGLDLSKYALSIVKKRFDIPLINGDLNNLPFKSNSVDIIIAMDVIEHLDNDINGIKEIYRTLKNGGVIIISVPAFKFLWGLQDIVTGHKRRYSLKDIKLKLKNNNFFIIKSHYFNFFLFYPIFFIRRLILILNLKIKSENEVNFPLLNFFLKKILLVEIFLSKFIKFPFGVSILCLAKKK